MIMANMRSERWKAAAGAAVLEVALAWVLVTGLAVEAPHAVTERLQVFGILPAPPKPPPPPPPAPRLRTPKKEGAASPANLRSTPTEVVAPTPRIVSPVPPPIVSAPLPGLGADPSAGASNVRGPGTGSSGEGNGTGSGSGGNGEGGGGGGSPPRFLKGEIRDKDYPKSAGEAGIGGIVDVQYVVGTDGRARNCRVTRSSGDADLDFTTCRLVEKRYRYKAATDGQGRPIDSKVADSHEWVSVRGQTPRDEER
ncbi:MAG: hypothetical protein JWO25_4 [Alphaproteobacteria bacterium]|nr:hypothetical protein [Alphaproteobacteria bacterium]